MGISYDYRIEQIFIPYTLWEEYRFGMWRYVYGKERDNYLKRAIKFTGNAKLYGRYMRKVIKLWLYSCAHNLSNMSINRQAWIGHAACCLAIGCPEDITRLAWHELSTKQQDDANNQADIAIEKWEKMLFKGIQSCLNIS